MYEAYTVSDKNSIKIVNLAKTKAFNISAFSYIFTCQYSNFGGQCNCGSKSASNSAKTVNIIIIKTFMFD